MKNQRRKYRVKTSGKEGLAAALILPDETTVPGRIRDLSASGVAVIFEGRRETVLPLREIVRLEFSAQALKEPVEAPCLVRHRAELDEGRLYGLEFVEPEKLLRKLPRALARLFNQRSTYRVQPPPGDMIKVVIEGKQLLSPIIGVLRDVSIHGISIQVPYMIENLLMKVEQVKAVFRLPGISEKLDFSGKIMHRHLIAGGIRYGLYFDPRRTPGFEKKRDALQKYVDERRRDLLPQTAAAT